jgi:molybdopterin-guanine dinucleotide biosynthesis protein A
MSGPFDEGKNAESDVTAFILAGGKSSRMGSDKAFLQLGGETLLQRALKLAREVAGEVRIVGDASKFKEFAQVVEDEYRERGPLGGIHAALTSSATELNLAIAVDLPFVTRELLHYMVAQARNSGAVVTVVRADGGWQPLCAVYRHEFAIPAQAVLNAGKNKIDALFTEVETRVVEEDELIRAGFSAEMFRNLNTPEELERAKKLLGG